MDHIDILEQFMQITSVNAADSRLILESANWNLELALANYFEDLTMAGGDTLIGQAQRRQTAGEERHECRSAERAACDQAPPPRPPQSCPRMGTIAGIRREGSCRDVSQDRQAFYAGGSENSGQQVLGPEPNDELFRRRREVISQMLQAALEQANTDDQAEHEGLNTGGSAFQGAGYRLGQRVDDTVLVPSLRGPGDDNRRRDVTLRLWREGFSVDDGPMRDYTSQENIAFLNEIRRGNIPNELLNEAEGGTVHLNMEDHRHESYVPIKSKVRAFAGKGHVLGSPTPAISSGNVRETAGATESRPANPSNNLNINPALPITTIQIRLADGSRLQATLNYTHTIADVRRYIIDNRPEFADRAFTLLTSFPSRELTQDTLTIEEAGLLGASILQRLL